MEYYVRNKHGSIVRILFSDRDDFMILEDLSRGLSTRVDRELMFGLDHDAIVEYTSSRIDQILDNGVITCLMI